MSTDNGNVPAIYNEIYEICSIDGSPITKEIFKELLKLSQLSASVLKQIWDMCSGPQEHISKANLFKGLAYIAFAQNGKVPSDKLLESLPEREYPIPKLGNLSVIKKNNQKLIQLSKNSSLNSNFSDLMKLDTIKVDLVPEKKGIFIKHSEYLVSSVRHNTMVQRRYNDFVALHELLLSRFPYRLIPQLPPKKIVFDSLFLETRRRALQRWLTIIACHPILTKSPLLAFFLTDMGSDHQNKIRDTFRRQPDEFTTSELAGIAKELLPANTNIEFAASRDQLQHIWSGVRKLRQICERGVERGRAMAFDAQELSGQLRELGTEPLGHSQWAAGSNTVWSDIKKGLGVISKEFTNLSNSALHTAIREEDAVCEQLGLLSDVLAAHSALCDRLERGVLNDHQRALQHMLSLKKKQIQGVIKGTDAESVDQLEAKMLQQENVISNMEMRNTFSLHCIHIETQLVHAYIEILAFVLNTMVSVQIQSHSELAEVWKLMQPTIVKCLPKKSIELSNSNSSLSQ